MSKELTQKMYQALLMTQWGFNLSRCPACSGWDGKSENDKQHTANCLVADAIASAEMVLGVKN